MRESRGRHLGGLRDRGDQALKVSPRNERPAEQAAFRQEALPEHFIKSGAGDAELPCSLRDGQEKGAILLVSDNFLGVHITPARRVTGFILIFSIKTTAMVPKCPNRISENRENASQKMKSGAIWRRSFRIRCVGILYFHYADL
ncbi:hypothetical protein [Shinella pollutisoli]